MAPFFKKIQDTSFRVDAFLFFLLGILFSFIIPLTIIPAVQHSSLKMFSSFTLCILFLVCYSLLCYRAKKVVLQRRVLLLFSLFFTFVFGSLLSVILTLLFARLYCSENLISCLLTLLFSFVFIVYFFIATLVLILIYALFLFVRKKTK